MQQCRNCGYTLPAGASHCPNCGTPVQPPSYDTTVAAPQPGYDPTVMAGNSGPGQSGPQYGQPQPGYDPTVMAGGSGPGQSGPQYGQPQPPTAYGTPPPPSDPYGGTPPPPSDPYGGQQGGYVAPPPGGGAYTPPPPGTFMPQQQPPKKNNTLVIVLSVIGAIVLIACIACGAILYGTGKIFQNTANSAYATATSISATATADSNDNPTATTANSTPTAVPTYSADNPPSGSPISSSAAANFARFQLSTGVDSDYNPTDNTTTFKTFQKVYATFRTADGKAGYAQAKWYFNGTSDGSSKVLQITADSASSYFVGYFSDDFSDNGPGAVEIYWCTKSDCSDGQLAKVLTFTVSDSASVNNNHTPLAITDMDRRLQ